MFPVKRETQKKRRTRFPRDLRNLSDRATLKSLPIAINTQIQPSADYFILRPADQYLFVEPNSSILCFTASLIARFFTSLVVR